MTNWPPAGAKSTSAAAELPIVTSDTPGCRALVSPGWNGLMVPSNSGRELADALVFLSAIGSRGRADMGRRSLQVVGSRFRLDQVVARSLDVYDSVISGDRIENDGNGQGNPDVTEVQRVAHCAGD